MLETDDLPPSWRQPLAKAFAAPATVGLRAFLTAELASGTQIFPEQRNWLRALALTPLQDVRVVILGQDPYPTPGNAHGLAFSVLPGVRPPGSLANIYKELQSDLGIAPASHGFLEPWARQGVLLLNNLLTVERGVARSHKGKGWEPFTTAIITAIADRKQPCVFLLWGGDAQKKAGFVDGGSNSGRHLVLKTTHPSSMHGSARKGFFGCRHFSRTNAWLEAQSLPPIDWALPPV